MSRYSPTVQPAPSWTNGMAQGAGSIANALMQRRMFNQQQNQQDIQNAENGVYRGAAPTGPLAVNTPDYEINDRPGYDDGTANGSVLPGQSAGPQVVQTSNASASYGGGRPVPGGISATAPLTNALLASRATGNGLPASTTGTVTFNGPTGQGLVDTSRYQQIATPSGGQFYLDREMTPDAQALRRSVVSGEAGLNRAIMTGMIRNQGWMDRTDANIDSYGPDGQRTQGRLAVVGAQGANQQAVADTRLGQQNSQFQQRNGSIDPVTHVFTPGTQAAGANYVNQLKPYHPPTGGNMSFGGGGGSTPSKQEATYIRNGMSKLMGTTSVPLLDDKGNPTPYTNKVTGMAATDAYDQLKHNVNLTRPAGADTLMDAPATAPAVPTDGHNASIMTPPAQGTRTPLHQNGKANQGVSTTGPMPASPTASNTGGDQMGEATTFQAKVKALNARADLSDAQKQETLANYRQIYAARVKSIVQH